MVEKIELTQQRVDAATCPPDQPEAVWHDKKLPGLQLRVKHSGAKSYTIRYRSGGRGSMQRRITLDAGKIPLGEARKEIRRQLGEIATGRDPAGERRERSAATMPGSAPHSTPTRPISRRRAVVAYRDRMSLLRREMLAPLGNVELGTITRNAV